MWGKALYEVTRTMNPGVITQSPEGTVQCCFSHLAQCRDSNAHRFLVCSKFQAKEAHGILQRLSLMNCPDPQSALMRRQAAGNLSGRRGMPTVVLSATNRKGGLFLT